MRRISVFCGSRTGNDPRIAAQAELFGKILAANNIELVYGGTRIGIMGILADSVLAGGGMVEGVMPSLIEERKIAHEHLTLMVQVADLEERKKRLIGHCDAIVVCPGSYGSMDELFGALVLKQLEKIDKPVVLVNIGGFTMRCFLRWTMVRTGFAGRFRSNLRVVTDCRDLHFLWE